MTDHVTLSGRTTNFTMRHLKPVATWFSRRQAAQYARSGGTKGTTFQGKPAFRLTVLGRTSGQPRSVMLMLVRRGEDLLVCGSQGGTPEEPNWWQNLVAAGTGVAQVGADAFDVVSRVVIDEAERAEAWTLLTTAYPDFGSYQALTARVLPVAVLSRTDG